MSEPLIIAFAAALIASAAFMIFGEDTPPRVGGEGIASPFFQ